LVEVGYGRAEASKRLKRVSRRWQKLVEVSRGWLWQGKGVYGLVEVGRSWLRLVEVGFGRAEGSKGWWKLAEVGGES
jgi:hypothetical protein